MSTQRFLSMQVLLLAAVFAFVPGCTGDDSKPSPTSGATNSGEVKRHTDQTNDAKQAAKSLKQATKAHEEGDYRTALQIRLPLAQEGSAEAQAPRGLDVLPRIWR